MRIGICGGLVGTLLIGYCVYGSSTRTTSALENISFEVRPVQRVVHTSPYLTRTGLLRFRGTLTNNSTVAVDVTPVSTGTVSVDSLTCGGKAVPSSQHAVVFDEDPRAVQRQRGIALSPNQSATLDDFLLRTVTWSDDKAFETTFTIEHPSTCEVVFGYKYGAVVARSKTVTFEVQP